MGASDLERVITSYRGRLATHERDARRRMQAAYRQTITSLERDLAAMQTRIATLQASGERIPTWRILREAELRQLLVQAEAAFDRYGQIVRRETADAERRAVTLAQDAAVAHITAAYGPIPPGVDLPIARLPTDALSRFVAAAEPDSPLQETFARFGPDAATTITERITAGMAAGTNSRIIARQITRDLGGARWKAERIVRTEMHRAYRGATLDTYRANRQLLKGWRWSAALSVRTCPACLALDGRIFDLDEPARMHVNCRCSVSPVVKPWKELGFDVNETFTPRQTGAEWFARQPEKIQRRILGPAAYQAYTADEVTLEDFVTLHRSQTWGSSYRRGSLAGARERAARRDKRAA
jgi:SPP1 gp7 family putative phage head morphogenesis protein